MSILPKRELYSCAFDAPRPGHARVLWEMTRNCNFECVHCCSDSAPRRPVPSLDNLRGVFDIADRAAGGRIQDLLLSGGEPLNLGARLVELVEHVRRRSPATRVAVSTNGYLVQPGNRVLDALIELGADRYIVSLDGGEATHDRFRRKDGSYRAVLDAIRLLKRRGCQVFMSVMLSELNACEIDGVLDDLTLLEVDAGAMQRVDEVGRALEEQTGTRADTVRDAAQRLLSWGREREPSFPVELVRVRLGAPLQRPMEGCHAASTLFITQRSADDPDRYTLGFCPWLLRRQPTMSGSVQFAWWDDPTEVAASVGAGRRGVEQRLAARQERVGAECAQLSCPQLPSCGLGCPAFADDELDTLCGAEPPRGSRRRLPVVQQRAAG